MADTLAAARRLRRQIVDPDLRPLCTELFNAVATFPELEQRLKFALEEGGRVADRASAALAMACVCSGKACASNGATVCRMS